MRREPPVPGRASALAPLLCLVMVVPAAPVAAQTTADTVDTAGPVEPTSEPGASQATPATPPPGAEARLHALINRRREAVGCRPLAWHPPAAAVAEARSVDMIGRRYFDHRTPDGRTVFDLLDEAGIEAWGSVAENIALTQAGAPSVLEMWRDSPPHRRNLENCGFTHQGLGQRGGVWTQILLAHPRPASAVDVSPREPASPPH